MQTKTISFTEIAAWKKCRQLHHWRYNLGLRPNRYAEHVTLGSLCHKAMEFWLKGDTRPLGTIVMEEVGQGKWDEELEQIDELVETAQKIVERYLQNGLRLSPPKGPNHLIETEFDLLVPRTTRRVQGRFDAVLQNSNGAYWLCEWKFPKTFRTEEDAQMSSQLAIYQWAAAQLGKPCVGIVYNQILQKLPAIPDQNKNGSTSRKEIYTDWDTYAATVRSRGEDPASYAEEMIPKLEGKEFWRSYTIYRSPEECEHFVKQLTSVTRDICNQNRRVEVYPCESTINCNGCYYRDLCLEVARGRSPEHLIESAFYRSRKTEEAIVDSAE